jgi:hypothetical protein
MLFKELTNYAFVKQTYGNHLPQVAWLKERQRSNPMNQLATGT